MKVAAGTGTPVKPEMRGTERIAAWRHNTISEGRSAAVLCLLAFVSIDIGHYF